jgi:hypothetical protein
MVAEATEPAAQVRTVAGASDSVLRVCRGERTLDGMEKEIAELKQKIAALEEWREEIIAEVSALRDNDSSGTLEQRIEALEAKTEEPDED